MTRFSRQPVNVPPAFDRHLHYARFLIEFTLNDLLVSRTALDANRSILFRLAYAQLSFAAMSFEAI